MKTYSLDICKYHVTITIEKRKYETTVKDVFDELTEEQKYKVIDRLKMAKDLVKSQSEEIKMEEKTDKFDPFYPNYLPFSEYCKAYILDHVDDYAEATLKGYKNIIDNHLDSLMVCDVQDVTETVIQNAFNAEIEKGLNKKTLKGYKSFILKVIEEGYDHKFKPEIHIEKESANETA